jgi:hypothetical protein
MRADGISIKCRGCNEVIYFKSLPAVTLEPLRIEREEPIESITMPPEIPERLEDEGTEQKALKTVYSYSTDRYRGTEHTYTAKKVPSPEDTKTTVSSHLYALFDQILEKMGSPGNESLSAKPSKHNHSLDVSYRTVLIVIVVCIILVGLLINVLSD